MAWKGWAGLILTGCLLPLTTLWGAETPPSAPWASQELIKASLELHLDETQQPVFRKSVGAFIDDYYRMIRKESRRNVPDQQRRIKRRTRSLTKQLDANLREALRQEQWPAYEQYRSLLLKALKSPGSDCCAVTLSPEVAPEHH